MTLRMTHTHRFLVLLAALLVGPSLVLAEPINVRDFGAVGDGVADDTEAVQKALNALASPDRGKLVIPTGEYRITDTLKLEGKAGRDSVIVGEGKSTRLFWAGEAGETLLETYGIGHTEVRDLSLSGHDPNKKRRDKEAGRAGILFHVISKRGGNHINRLANLRFTDAEVGIQMGINENDFCNADYSFAHIHASRLGTFFRAVNNQAVDFLFNFLFALDCDTVFDFQRGGNLTVNNAQLTKCGLYLNIEGGGRNAATFINTNVRHEEARQPKVQRDQLLRATNIKWEQALVKFIGFDDAQWNWFRIEASNRDRPLCEIGPGVNVVFESSAFNGPIAQVNGRADKPASIVLRECTYGFILPHQALGANEHGYIRSVGCFTDFLIPLPDLVKWPDVPTMRVAADQRFEPGPAPPPIRRAGDAIERLNQQREAWVEMLEAEATDG